MNSYITDGGVVDFAQTVYLDFDGALAAYNGELLTVDGVEVASSNLSEERIGEIVALLNSEFAPFGVTFTATKPESGDFSTVFVGNTAAFAEIGNIRGIAETIDEGNLNKADNAFVLLDATFDNSLIANTIAHEVGHLLGNRHGGDGIAAYLAEQELTVSAGEVVSDTRLYHSSFLPVPMPSLVSAMHLYGTAINTAVNGGAIQYVYSGGVDSGATINSSGIQHVYSGGMTESAKVGAGGTQYISAGAVAYDTIVDGNEHIGKGTQHVYGIVSNTTINKRATQYIYTGAEAYDTTANEGTQYVYGVASSNTIDNGTQYIIGGSAFDNICRDQYLSGGFASNNTVAGSQYITDGGVASNNTVGGNQYISGGIAIDNVVNDWGRNQYITDGGVASNNTVGQNQYITGGSAFNSVIGGAQHISNGFAGGNVFSGAVSAGQHIYSGGVARENDLGSRGIQYIYSGGIASDSVISGRAMPSGGQYISSGGIARNTIISASIQTIYAGGVASGTTILEVGQNRYGNDQNIHSGGVAYNTTLFSNASQSVSGIASRTTIYSGAVQYVTSGGSARYATISGGTQDVSNAVARDTDIYAGVQKISNSATVRDTRIYSGGSQYLDANMFEGGSVASDTFVYDGGVQYVSRGLAKYGTIYSGGTQEIRFMASASGFMISSGGVQISYGADVHDTVVYEGGVQHISGGSISETTLLGGTQQVYSLAWIKGIYIYSGGEQIVCSGRVESAFVYSGGRQELQLETWVEDLEIENGGSVIVTGADTAIYGNVSIGGTLTTNGYVVDAKDSIYAFDMRSVEAGAPVRIDNLENLINVQSWSLSISTSNEQGIYRLAGGAADFDASVSVTVNYTNIGELTVGSTLEYNSLVYALERSSDNILFLSISDPSVVDNVDWPAWWSEQFDVPATAKAIDDTGVVGAEHLVSGNVYAGRTEFGKSYASISFDTALESAAFFARISGGIIGTFRGGKDDNFLYMTDGAITTLYGGVGTSANSLIEIGGGTVGTIYGGGESGGKTGNILISGGVFTNIYGGGVSGNTENVITIVTGGTINRVRGGADAGGSVGNATTVISGGTITGQIVGGGLGDAGNILLNIDIDSERVTGAYIYGGSIGGDVSGTIITNITKGAYQGIIVAGSRAAGKGVSTTVTGQIALGLMGDVEHISNPLAIASKVDTAWIFAGQAVSGGSFTGNGTHMRVGNGAQVKYLVGGAMADGVGSVATVTDVAVSINAGVVNGGIWGAGYSFGGGVASAQNVRITIYGGNADNNTSIYGNINTGGIVLDSLGAVNYATGTVVLTGSGDYLDFSKTVSGAGADTSSTLEFSNFTGGFNGVISDFKRVAFTGDSSVDIRNAYTDCTELVFDLSDRTSEEAFITSIDSFQFAGGADNYIGLVLDTTATGEIFTELMGVSDLSSLEGVKIGLLNKQTDDVFYATFDLGTVYQGDGFELVVDYDSGVLFSLFTA